MTEFDKDYFPNHKFKGSKFVEVVYNEEYDIWIVRTAIWELDEDKFYVRWYEGKEEAEEFAKELQKELWFYVEGIIAEALGFGSMTKSDHLYLYSRDCNNCKDGKCPKVKESRCIPIPPGGGVQKGQ